MKKFELFVSSGAGAGLASGVTVAVPGAGGTPGAPVVSGAATDAPGAAASGAVERAGEVSGAGGGFSAGLVAGGAAGLCAKLVSATLREQRLTISVFFIFSRVDDGQKISPIGAAVVYSKENCRPSSLIFFEFLAGAGSSPVFY